MIWSWCRSLSRPLSGLQTGAGTPLLDPGTAVYDSSRDRVLVWEAARAAIIAAEGVDGDRTVFSDHVTGTGVALSAVRRMVLDSARDRVIALEAPTQGGQLVAIDLATGNREVLEDLGAGGAPAIMAPRGLALSADGDDVFVGDDTTNSIIRITLASGVRNIVSDASNGTGPQFDGIRDLVLEPGLDRLLLLDAEGLAVYAVVTGNGSRTLITSDEPTSGPALAHATILEYGTVDGAVFVAGASAVWWIDTDTGTRSLLSGGTLGSGPLQQNVAGMALDTIRGDLIAVSRAD